MAKMKLNRNKLKKLAEQGAAVAAPSGVKRKKMDKSSSKEAEEKQPNSSGPLPLSGVSPVIQPHSVVRVVDVEVPL